MSVPRMIMATGTSHPASGTEPSRQIQPSESYRSQLVIIQMTLEQVPRQEL